MKSIVSRFKLFILLSMGIMIHNCFCANDKVIFSKAVIIKPENHIPPEGRETRIEVESYLQCLVSCHLQDSCKTFAFGDSNCYHFTEVIDGTDLVEKQGYNYYTVEDLVKSSATHGEDTTTITTTPVYTTTDREKTYELFKDPRYWDDAEKKCEERNGRLACIHDKETNDKITKLISDQNPNTDVWIGLESLSKNGPFRWTDGTEVSADKNAGYFHNYLDKDPDDYKNNEVGVRILFKTSKNQTFKKWADMKKNKDAYWYVCESP